ncbi:MAG: CBS domain-containing protein [candidate division Zixibacteria bacterium]|nr:CBS domain-containing protein [candidate division Zixibacteria bacterium]
MLVQDLLKKQPKTIMTVGKGTNVLAAMQLLIDNNISCLPIVENDNRLIGIISDKDIFKAVYDRQDAFVAFKVGDLMETNLIVGVEADDINYIAGLMTNNRIRHIPIVDRDRIIGLISVGDIVKVQMKSMEVENRYLKLYIDGSYPG